MARTDEPLGESREETGLGSFPAPGPEDTVSLLQGHAPPPTPAGFHLSPTRSLWVSFLITGVCFPPPCLLLPLPGAKQPSLCPAHTCSAKPHFWVSKSLWQKVAGRPEGRCGWP